MPGVSGYFRSKKAKTFLDFRHPVFSTAPFLNRIAALAWRTQLRESFSRFSFRKAGGRDQWGSHRQGGPENKVEKYPGNAGASVWERSFRWRGRPDTLGEFRKSDFRRDVGERLVAQEARRLGIQVSEDMVQQELRRISREIYGTQENFQARLREEGVSTEDLQNHFRNQLLYEAVKTAKSLPGSDPDMDFNTWLVQAKQKAEIAIYDSPDLTGDAPSGSCCRGGASSGGSGERFLPGGRPVDPRTESEAKTAALEDYQKANPAEKGVTAKVTDYGCHIQVDVQKDGKVVKSYTYRAGKVFEIS